MPTSVRLYTPAEQADQRAKLLMVAAAVDVWECESGAGRFELKKVEGKYVLGGSGLKLFAADPQFGTIRIDATCDEDAAGSAMRLILERWDAEGADMRRKFFPPKPTPATEYPACKCMGCNQPMSEEEIEAGDLCFTCLPEA